MEERTGGPEAAVGVKMAGDPGDSLQQRLEKLTFAIEKMNLAEYTALLRNPWRLLWVNFMAGSARGLGLGFGFAVLSAGILYILRGIMMAKLPYISDFIATIVRLVDQNLKP
ncbi:MAG TPA: DUF5665 domain-containing protein [Symbiobacteriaceae bacterium]|nr:DUF5665 domain-containing protein [Symbiobacteriaceae bacterium]